MLNGRNEEDRRIYERSARLIFLLALRDVAPGAKVAFEHSLGNGVYLSFAGIQLNRAILARIEARMHEITEANHPIGTRRLSREEAVAYFTAMGRDDTVRLLRYRPFDYLDIVECDGYGEYFYGAMAASTGEVRHYALRMYYPGAVLLLPTTDFDREPEALIDRPGLAHTYREAKRLSGISGCRYASDLNGIIDRGEMRTLIRVCEAQQQHAVADAARRITEKAARIVFVAGPSSSGKTTFANRLGVELRALGRKPVSISLDNYYKNRQDVPIGPDGKLDLECLESIDVALFEDHLVSLLDGMTVEVPRYSFVTKSREPQGEPMSIGPEDILIVEGIHGLNPELSDSIPAGYKFLIYVSALTPLSLDLHNRIRATDARLIRRMVRDLRTRGASVAETMDMWDSVRAGEEKYIFPFQERADFMFNTSLAYELPILKSYAYALLAAVKPGEAHYTRARRLVKLLNYFRASEDQSEIPPTSILREFIGGCTFYPGDLAQGVSTSEETPGVQEKEARR